MSTDRRWIDPSTRRPQTVVWLVMSVVALPLVLAGCSKPATTQGNANSAATVSTVSALLLDETPEEKFEKSAVVVLAIVEGPKGEFVVEEPAPESDPEPIERWAYSEWSVVPKKVYKSDGVVRKGVPITVALRGGLADGEEIYWGEEAELTPGEEVLLFLGTDTGPGTAAPGRYFTHQLALGKYRIDRRSGMARSKLEDRSVKFTDLEKKLK